MVREQPTLTVEQRVRLATACLENALHLIRGAEALVASGELPNAVFLVGSAWEEVLKARYCIDVGAPSWGAWWDGYRSHRTKLNVALRSWPQLTEDSTRSLRDLRERSLYVEVNQDGDPLTPRGLVDPGGLEANFILGWSRWIQEEGRATLERLMLPAKITLPAVGEQPNG